MFYRCDVTDNTRVREIAEKVKKEVGDITILINNAGIMPCHKIFNLTPDQIRSQFDINVLSHFWASENLYFVLLYANFIIFRYRVICNNLF